MQMLPFDELKQREEQRLEPFLAAWNSARENLKSAIALAETREKEYRDAAAEVDRKLDALKTVSQMLQELGSAPPSPKPLPEPKPQALMLTEQAVATGMVRATSRKLFSLPSVSLTSRTAVSHVSATKPARSILGLR